MQTQQVAYNLNEFAQKPQQKLRVVENKDIKKLKVLKVLRNVKIVFLTSMILALAYFVLTSQSTITALSGEIAEKQDLLTEEKANYDFMTDKLGGNVDLEKVGKYAEQNLGMIKMDKTQVEYITMENENEIEVKKESVAGAVESISTGFMNIMEYLAP
ncbi:MAG: hypothetical protein RR902_02465 [Oscillospiraceae bacterium]